MQYRAENDRLKEVVTELDLQLQKKDFQLFNLIQDNTELNDKYREAMGRLESGESAKDKIISKLKTQLREGTIEKEDNEY